MPLSNINTTLFHFYYSPEFIILCVLLKKCPFLALLVSHASRILTFNLVLSLYNIPGFQVHLILYFASLDNDPVTSVVQITRKWGHGLLKSVTPLFRPEVSCGSVSIASLTSRQFSTEHSFDICFEIIIIKNFHSPRQYVLVSLFERKGVSTQIRIPTEYYYQYILY